MAELSLRLGKICVHGHCLRVKLGTVFIKTRIWILAFITITTTTILISKGMATFHLNKQSHDSSCGLGPCHRRRNSFARNWARNMRCLHQNSMKPAWDKSNKKGRRRRLHLNSLSPCITRLLGAWNCFGLNFAFLFKSSPANFQRVFFCATYIGNAWKMEHELYEGSQSMEIGLKFWAGILG